MTHWLALDLRLGGAVEQDALFAGQPGRKRPASAPVRKAAHLIDDLNLTSKLEYGAQPCAGKTPAGPLFRQLVAQLASAKARWQSTARSHWNRKNQQSRPCFRWMRRCWHGCWKTC